MERMERKTDKEEEKGKLEGLPEDTSPYTQYKDLEDYKKQGYGTQGHQQPNPGRGATSSIDAPTAQSQLCAIDRHDVP